MKRPTAAAALTAIAMSCAGAAAAGDSAVILAADVELEVADPEGPGPGRDFVAHWEPCTRVDTLFLAHAKRCEARP